MSYLILAVMLLGLAALAIAVTLPDLAPGNGKHVLPAGTATVRPHHHKPARHARTDLVRTT